MASFSQADSSLGDEFSLGASTKLDLINTYQAIVRGRYRNFLSTAPASAAWVATILPSNPSV